jgi:hypothetical protein
MVHDDEPLHFFYENEQEIKSLHGLRVGIPQHITRKIISFETQYIKQIIKCLPLYKDLVE